MHAVGDHDDHLAPALGEVRHVLVEVAERADQVAVSGEGIEEIEPAEDRIDVGLGGHPLGDLGLRDLSEAQQVEGVAVAQVVLYHRGDDEVGDVLEIGEDALRHVEKHHDVRGVGIAPGGRLRGRLRPSGEDRSGQQREGKGDEGRVASFRHASSPCGHRPYSFAASMRSTLYWNLRSWIRKLRCSPALWFRSFLPRGER